MNYLFITKCFNKSAEVICHFIHNGLSSDVMIRSIKDKIHYTINHVTKEEICFSAETRNQHEPEVIQFEDSISVIRKLQRLEQFNTSSARESFKGTRIYKKDSPFFALLLSSNVIERFE